jgi:hypothetical protein
VATAGSGATGGVYSGKLASLGSGSQAGAGAAKGTATGAAAATGIDAATFGMTCMALPQNLHFTTLPAQSAGMFSERLQPGHVERTTSIVGFRTGVRNAEGGPPTILTPLYLGNVPSVDRIVVRYVQMPIGA